MKIFLPVVVSLAVVAATFTATEVAQAQAQEGIVELLRADIRLKRRAILTQNLKFTAKQSEKFWPLYRDYESRRAEIEDQILSQVKKFAENYESMNEKTASELIKSHFELSQKREAAKEDFVDEVSDEISPLTAARFLQIENQLDRVVQIQAASKLPLVVDPKSAIGKPQKKG